MAGVEHGRKEIAAASDARLLNGLSSGCVDGKSVLGWWKEEEGGKVKCCGPLVLNAGPAVGGLVVFSALLLHSALSLRRSKPPVGMA